MAESEQDRLVRRALSTLREHFDAVTIMATRYNSDTDETDYYAHGSGNCYANYGMLMEALRRYKENLSEPEEVA